MMLAGELDACMSYNRRQGDLIDRSDADLEHHPDIGPLFPNSAVEASAITRRPASIRSITAWS